MSLDQSMFEAIADKVLSGFLDVLDEQLGDCLDADLVGGILTIDLDSGGQYVISKHGPNRQIWMSSPLSGASHFDYDSDRGVWANTRGGEHLFESLARELESISDVGDIDFQGN